VLCAPRGLPDGTQITFQSCYDGNLNVWTISADGSKLRQLTEGPFDHREPRWVLVARPALHRGGLAQLLRGVSRESGSAP
jgi:hypothetical protein